MTYSDKGYAEAAEAGTKEYEWMARRAASTLTAARQPGLSLFDSRAPEEATMAERTPDRPQRYAPAVQDRGRKDNTVIHADSSGSVEEGAMTAYGESSGLYPQLNKKGGSIYNRNNWDPESFKQLQEARKYMADVRKRNKKTHQYKPGGNNPIEQMVWQDSVRAAEGTVTWSLPKDVKNFVMRQGRELQQPDWATGLTPYATFGPFINVGGNKDVPKGPETYIDFYQGVP